MSELFILEAFRKCGEKPVTVRIMKNKYSGENAGYCFVNFLTDDAALDAMHKLNGKPIPNTNPVARFRLNSASNSYKSAGSEREFSVWVGDLSSDVDDYSLYKVFSTKYTSIKTAKVIIDNSGFSKGYGFVRFGIEEEQKAALWEMNGFLGLGTRPIKICNAVPKPKGELDSPTSVQASYGYDSSIANQLIADPSAQYTYDASANYWQGYNAWQNYYDQGGDPSAYYQQSLQQAHSNPQTLAQHAEAWSQSVTNYERQKREEEENKLVEHQNVLDVDKMNREMVERDKNLWDALESSKWLPLDMLETY